VRRFVVIRGEIEWAVSPPLPAELCRILPWPDAEPNAAALRTGCAGLVSWGRQLGAGPDRAAPV